MARAAHVARAVARLGHEATDTVRAALEDLSTALAQALLPPDAAAVFGQQKRVNLGGGGGDTDAAFARWVETEGWERGGAGRG